MVRQIVARETLEKAYREEKDADVSRRILLVLKVRCDGVKRSQAAKELISQTPEEEYSRRVRRSLRRRILHSKGCVIHESMGAEGKEAGMQNDWLYLFLDRAKHHHKTEKVLAYMSRNRATLRVRWIPVGSPAFNVMEEYWRQMDNDLLASRFYSSC